MVLAAAIVGSGELIATTTLGAQVGFAVLWIIVLSCAIKPVVQGEFGRYTIATGHTALEGFNCVPGPRAGVGWLVWIWAATVTLTLLQVGGMYGGVAQVLHILVPAIPVNAWVGVCFVVTLALLLGGGYERIERLAIVKVGLFTLLTVCAAAILLRRPGAVSVADLQSGFSFQLPSGRSGDGDCCFRHHRRRRDRTRDVSVLVRGEGLRQVRRGARRLSGVDGARARLDSRDAPRHHVLAGRLHDGHGGFLPARRRRAEPHGARARGPRHDCRALEHLHADARRVDALAVLPGRRDHALRHHLRLDGRARAPVCRRRAHRRRLRAETMAPAVFAGATASSCCSQSCR